MAKTAQATKQAEPEAYDPDTGEVMEAPASTAGVLTAFAQDVVAGKIKVVRKVSLPVLPFRDGMTIVAKLVDKIRTGKAVENATIKTAAQLVTIEAMNGEQRTLIVNKVLEKELDQAYPDTSYIGKWFRIKREAAKAGKRYPIFVIEEVEVS